MLKKILVVTMILISFVYAKEKAPKSGCILAQKGEVSVAWQDDSGKGGLFDNVVYTAVRPQGINFKEIFVGSTIKVTKDKKIISLKILDIKSNKRVKPNPRTGTIKFELSSNGITKNVLMSYYYDKSTMRAVGIVDAFGINSISFKTAIEALLCKI